ncbi:MAG: SUMF1/EgtB/PvdO family nonheme iron enzyme [Bacteroidota bacterium]
MKGRRRNDSYRGAPDEGSAWMNRGKKDRRVVRGGSWIDSYSVFFRVSDRDSNSPYSRNGGIGFRLCRSIS